MITYSEFSPTCFDPAGAFLPDRQDWFVAPVSRTRDSGPLSESNFEAALLILGGESDTVEVHAFGHWGPGWFELILVAPDSSQAGIVEEIERSLEYYPVLNDTDLSEREWVDACESWTSWGFREFRRAIGNAHDLSDNADNLIDEWDRDNAFGLYLDLARVGYETHSDGTRFPDIGYVAGAMGRGNIARLLRKLRDGETEPYKGGE